MKIYHTETQQDYDALMVELEEKGCKWASGVNPTAFDSWYDYKEKTYVKEGNKELTYGNVEISYVNSYSEYPLIEYKAKKGEDMLNTECKQCHKKWHHENAKYCSMCGKKLFSDHEFKAGDIVSSEIFINGSGIVMLEEDLINYFTVIEGLWYTNDDCEIKETSYGVSKANTRHATQEEVSVYEAALNFHKHGRKPFEIRQGDITSDDEGYKFFIGNPNIWDKEDFTSGKHTLLKTAEEVNEWLGVADE